MRGKRILAALMTAMMAIMLFGGCGGEKKQETVKIGFLAPLTGGNAAFGMGMKNSAQLAVDQANASGKYPFKFELVVADDGGDPTTAVSAANKLIADKDIVAVGGHFNSGCALATAPVFHKNGTALVVSAAIHPDITGHGYKEIDRVITVANVQNKFAGELAVKEWGVKKIALINDRTDYGKTNAGQFAEAAKASGAEIISEDGITIGQQDFTALLTKIKAENPDCIYFGGVATEAGLLKRQMADLQMDVLFLSDSGILSDTFNQVAGASAQGMIGFNIGKPLDQLPGGKKFMDDYKAAGFAEPYETYGPYAYDTVGLMIEAIGKEKATTRKKAIDAIRKIVYNGLLGETSFDENGQTKNAFITPFISQDGKWIPYNTAALQVKDKKVQKK